MAASDCCASEPGCSNENVASGAVNLLLAAIRIFAKVSRRLSNYEDVSLWRGGMAASLRCLYEVRISPRSTGCSGPPSAVDGSDCAKATAASRRLRRQDRKRHRCGAPEALGARDIFVDYWRAA